MDLHNVNSKLWTRCKRDRKKEREGAGGRDGVRERVTERVKERGRFLKTQQPWVTLQCVIISLSAAPMILACFQLFIHTPKFNNKMDYNKKK